MRHWEVIGLHGVLLLMDTFNESSQLGTVAYRLYRARVQYSVHKLCNVDNTLSSDSCCCVSSTPSSRSESEGGIAIRINWLFRNATSAFWKRDIWSIRMRTKSCNGICNAVSLFTSRSTVQWVKQKKLIGQISLDHITPGLLLNCSNKGRARVVLKISAAWYSVFTYWALILSFGASCWIKRWKTSMSFVRAMDSIELAIFPALKLSQNIVFLQVKIVLSTL